MASDERGYDMLTGIVGSAVSGQYGLKNSTGFLDEIGKKLEKELAKAEQRAVKKADRALRDNAVAGAVNDKVATPKVETPVAAAPETPTGSNPGQPVAQSTGSNYVRPEVAEVEINDIEAARQRALKTQEDLKVSDMIANLASVETKEAVAMLQPAAEGTKTSYSEVVSAYAETTEEAA